MGTRAQNILTCIHKSALNWRDGAQGFCLLKQSPYPDMIFRKHSVRTVEPRNIPQKQNYTGSYPCSFAFSLAIPTPEARLGMLQLLRRVNMVVLLYIPLGYWASSLHCHTPLAIPTRGIMGGNSHFMQAHTCHPLYLTQRRTHYITGWLKPPHLKKQENAPHKERNLHWLALSHKWISHCNMFILKKWRTKWGRRAVTVTQALGGRDKCLQLRSQTVFTHLFYFQVIILMLWKSEKKLMLFRNFNIIVGPSWFCSELKLTDETMLKIGSDM